MLKCARLAALVLGVVYILGAVSAFADPISTSPRVTFSGNMDYVVTAGSLRTQPNTGNACAVGATSTESLSGIPLSASIVSAYLYWAGSGPTPDYNVTLNGSAISADRTFSEAYTAGGYNLQFFSGFADVTAQVSGNASFTFGGLTVTNTNLGAGQNYCSSQAVLAGWGLVVVYEDSAEPLRVINLFDGFQQFRGTQVQLSPSNFVLPSSPVDGKIGILSWEGDSQNSGALNGVTENLIFNGQSTPSTPLTDALNPVNNQYNSTVNVNGASNTWGVDFDVYDVSSFLRAGDTSAQTSYASGSDLVLLSVELISVTNEPAADLEVSLSHTGNFSTAATNTWAVDVVNNGPSLDPGPITVASTLASGSSYQGFSSSDPNWSCSAVAQDVTCIHTGPLPANTALASLSLLVDTDISTLPSVSNTVTVTSPTFDYFLANNSASDTAAVVVPVLTTSSKTVTDLNGGVANAGDVLRYRIRVQESAGAAVSGVNVSDVLDSQLSNLNVVDVATGIDNSSATTFTVDALSVPANNYVDVVFDATIVGSASNGDIIPNIAAITNPADASVTNVASADVVVGLGSPPASGIKPLYFGDIGGTTNNPTLPMTLSRTPLTGLSSPTRVRIRRQDNNRVWALTPLLQTDFTIDAADIPVYLQLRRSGNSNNRNIRVSIDYSGASNGFYGCVDVTLSAAGANGLSNSVTREFLFTVPRSDTSCNPLAQAPVTVDAGTQLQVRVDNEPNPGPGGRAIFVYPYSDAGPNTSRAEIPATTVINVDSVGLYDAAGAGNLLTTVQPGDTVYLRAQVSDPFGTFDIAGTNYELFDPSLASQASGPLPVIVDTNAATVTVETPITIPLTATQGIWSFTVTAIEGTEGIVTHSVQLPFSVVIANFVLEKLVSTVSDPISGTANPKSIPDAVHEYVIRATNDGPAPADLDSVFIRDDLPAEMRLYFGGPATPVTFVDGSPVSGLSFTFTALGNGSDDISFSNDGGSTFVTPSVGVDGYDTTVPPINYLEVNPKGIFNAPSGSGSPSFELRFQMRLE